MGVTPIKDYIHESDKKLRRDLFAFVCSRTRYGFDKFLDRNLGNESAIRHSESPRASTHSKAKESIREAVNKWIRNSGAFDGMIDFNAAVRNPDHPTRLLPKFASKDHLHPNDAGYKAIADSIDVDLFK